jgi:hypothetical protein
MGRGGKERGEGGVRFDGLPMAETHHGGRIWPEKEWRWSGLHLGELLEAALGITGMMQERARGGNDGAGCAGAKASRGGRGGGGIGLGAGRVPHA